MCAIAGVLSLDHRPVSRDSVEKMGRAIRHRGPDEEGFYFAPELGMTIQRLKVIDLVSGSQPIYNETKDVAVIFNGEIYNYRELRRTLEGKGHRFSTQSDTETIAHLYEEYGPDCLNHLNGMFAIALWDAKRRRLMLARDRAGIKPLLYSTVGGRLRFASEIKAFLADPEFPRAVDPQALSNYLSFYYATAPATIYRDIRRLPAGHRLIAENGAVRVESYWDLRYEPDDSLSLEDWKAQFKATLDASVARHMHSEVPVGIYLSGGLDSASIVASARALNSRLQTYSVGYEERSYSELDQARKVASFYGTTHHEFVLQSDHVRDLLPEVVRHLDEPHGDWSSLPNYFLSREAKKTVTVVLVGTGGDELFGGYPTYLAAKAARAYRQIPAWVRSGLIGPLVRSLPSSTERMSFDFIAKAFVRGADGSLEQAHHRFKEIFNQEERLSLQRTSHGSNPFAVFEQYRDSYGRMDWLDRLMYLDFKVFMADCSLQVNDMTTSAHSLEGRVPFLDAEMLALAARLPARFKVRNWTTKYLMRQAMAEFLPPEIVRMPKKGFLIPGASWIKGPLKPMIQDVFSSAEKRLGEIFDFSYVRGVLRDHCDGRQDHTRQITCLTSLFLWDEMFKPTWPALPVGTAGGRA